MSVRVVSVRRFVGGLLTLAVIVIGATAAAAEDGDPGTGGLQRAWSELLEARSELLRAETEAEAMQVAALRRVTGAEGDLEWITAELDAARLRLTIAVEARDRAEADRRASERGLQRAERSLERSRDTLGSHAATIYKHGPPALGPVETLLRSGSPGDYLVHQRLSQAVLLEDDAAVDRAAVVRDRATAVHRRAVTDARAAQADWEMASDEVDALTTVEGDQRQHLRSAARASRLLDREVTRAGSDVSENAAALLGSEDRIAEIDEDLHAALVERRLAAEGRVRAELAEAYPFLGRPLTRGRPPSMPPILDYHCPVPGGTFTNDWAFPRPGGRSHEGTDVFAPRHAPVLAVAAGEVVDVDTHDDHDAGDIAGDLGGRTVTIQTEVGERWYYAHLHTIADGVEVRAHIEAGQPVGTNGDSGNAQGGAPHLHLGRTWQGRPVNPWPSLAIACR